MAQSPLGHVFENDDLSCRCGTMFDDHHNNPRVCSIVSTSYNRKPKLDALPLERLRIALGLSNQFVASQVGLSTETVRRAVNGEVGGKHLTSQKTGQRVEQFIRDIACATEKT